MQIITLPVGDYQANCYIVYDDDLNAFIIDPGAEAQRVLRTVEQYGLKIEAVLLTHAHFDHIAAADTVLKATGAPLFSPKPRRCFCRHRPTPCGRMRGWTDRVRSKPTARCTTATL